MKLVSATCSTQPTSKTVDGQPRGHRLYREPGRRHFMAQTVRSPALRQRSARPADPGTRAPRRCAFIGTRGDRAIGLLMCRKGFRPSCRRRRSRCWTCCCRRSAPSGRGSWPAGRWSASDSGCWSEFYRVKADTALVRGHLARNGFAISCALAGMAGLTTAGTGPLSRCPRDPLRAASIAHDNQ
jgi:hypothetical protein